MHNADTLCQVSSCNVLQVRCTIKFPDPDHSTCLPPHAAVVISAHWCEYTQLSHAFDAALDHHQETVCCPAVLASPVIMIELPYHTSPCDVQVGNVSASVFNTGQEQHSLPVIMKRLQNITIKRSRGTFNKLSIINKMRATVNASSKRFKADHSKTDATTSGSIPDILPDADGKTRLKCVVAWPKGSNVAKCRGCQPLSHCHGDA